MRAWPRQARTRSQDRPTCLRLPDRATAPGRPWTASRNAPAARSTCRRPRLPLQREYRRDQEERCRPTPLAQEGNKMAPSPSALTSPIAGVQVAKPTTAPGWRRAITGRLKQIPMFAQVSFYRKHQARAHDRGEQPARADGCRLPPTELTRRGRCGPGLGRPGPACRRSGKSASPSRLALGSESRSACRG